MKKTAAPAISNFTKFLKRPLRNLLKIEAGHDLAIGAQTQGRSMIM